MQAVGPRNWTLGQSTDKFSSDGGNGVKPWEAPVFAYTVPLGEKLSLRIYTLVYDASSGVYNLKRRY